MVIETHQNRGETTSKSDVILRSAIPKDCSKNYSFASVYFIERKLKMIRPWFRCQNRPHI